MSRLSQTLALLCALLTFASITHAKGVEDAHSRTEEAETTRKVFAEPGTITAATLVTDITFTAECATVMEDATNTFTVTVNGKTVVGVDKTTSRDLWVKASQGWLEKRSTILTDS